jgi:uncharacterized protein (DUF1015 family)
MGEVIPFQGIIYNTSKVQGDEVVAPPYDIITSELKDLLYKKSQYNIARIDSGEEFAGDNEKENKYVRAARYFVQWQKDHVLIRSLNPCFYAYEMEFASDEGHKKLQGFLGLVKLVELGNGVYPHEETHSKPKVDRLNLMIACNANTSPIFSLYHTPEGRASAVVEETLRSSPYMEARDPFGAVHRIWPIEGVEDIRVIQEDLADRAIIIADGHHRYETALEYCRMMGGNSAAARPYNYVLMFLANISSDGITILPAHRIVKHPLRDILTSLEPFFEIIPVPVGEEIVRKMRGSVRTFGLYQKGDTREYLLSYKGDALASVHPSLRNLDVVILHELILKKILAVSEVVYEMDAAVAKEKVISGSYDAVFFLNPTRVADVEKAALSSVRMPPKSTYFYPKVMTGFVINDFNNTF